MMMEKFEKLKKKGEGGGERGCIYFLDFKKQINKNKCERKMLKEGHPTFCTLSTDTTLSIHSPGKSSAASPSGLTTALLNSRHRATYSSS